MTRSAECYFLNLCEKSILSFIASLGHSGMQSLGSAAKCKQDILSDIQVQLERTHTLWFLPCSETNANPLTENSRAREAYCSMWDVNRILKNIFSMWFDVFLPIL